MDIYSLYKITNLINNKVYVGWTSRDPFQRYKEHQCTRKPKHQDRSIISYAIEKYGKDNFTFEIIYQSQDYEHSREIETYFIAEHNSTVDNHGYNIDLGGTGHKRSKSTIEKHRKQIKGRKQTEEHKKKKADAISGEKNGMYRRGDLMAGEKNPMYGNKLSEEHLTKIRKTKEKTGAWKTQEEINEIKRIKEESGPYSHSEETKRKNSEGMKGKPSKGKGKPRSEETKRKISEGQRLRHQSKKGAEAPLLSPILT
jgi:group I intron endonuclease